MTHIPSVSVDPGDIGRRLIRRYVVDSDTLLLSGTWTWKAETLTFTVHWKRAPREK